MNRAERRRLARQGVTDKDIKHLYQRTKKESINQTVRFYSLAMAMVLHDKWGFGEIRLKRFLDQTQEMFDAINEGYLDFNDIHKVLLDECKVDI